MASRAAAEYPREIYRVLIACFVKISDIEIMLEFHIYCMYYIFKSNNN